MTSTPDVGGAACCYLSDLSPKDKPWDRHKDQAQRMRDLLSGSILDRLAGRIEACSGFLEFGASVDGETGERAFKLKSARFCRVRQCPICQWRRSLMWISRFLKALPAITGDYPKARWLFLTLTVRNCELTELRATVKDMNAAWKRMALRKQFPAIGYVRSTEVTRGKDGSAHPHFHALLMVEPGYFQGGRYLSQQAWSQLWQQVLGVSYTPVVDVRRVKDGLPYGSSVQELGKPDPSGTIAAAVVETLKYSVKPDDLIGVGKEADKEWLIELMSQLHKTRAVALGGVIKHYLSEQEPEDLIGTDESELENDFSVWFGWREMVKRYAKVDRP